MHAKSFLTVGGAAFLASRYVFETPTRKAALIGIAAGLAMVAVLTHVQTKQKRVTGTDPRNSNPATPETDVSSGNIHPENYQPIWFSTGAPLNNRTVAHTVKINGEAGQAFKNQRPTFNIDDLSES